MKMKPIYMFSIFITFSSLLHAADIVKRYSDPSFKAPINKYPWIVQLTYNGRPTATGFLINKRYVITAAHAVDTYKERWCLAVNFLNYETKFSMRVNRVSLSPFYSHLKDIFNDIAVLELSHPVDKEIILSSIPSIDFQSYSCTELYSIKNCISSGYARRGNLREANLEWNNNIFSEPNPGCNSPTGPYRYYLSYDGYAENGDSGSPLFYWKNGTYHVLGVHIQSAMCNNCVCSYEPIMHNADFLKKATGISQGSTEQPQIQIPWHDVFCFTSTASTVLRTSAITLLFVALLTKYAGNLSD